jgi:hypothetical protein
MDEAVRENELEEKIDDLVDEIEEINGDIYDMAQNSAPRGKIKTERIDWTKVDELDERYEIWYTQASTLVSEYMPERVSDFRRAYSDMDELLHFDGANYKDPNQYCGILRRVISRQKNILLSIPSKLDVERLKIRKSISDEIITEELYQAKHLLDKECIRGAGVVAGVALERYLLTLCETSGREIEYEYSDGINSLAESLYQANEIDQTKKSQLEYLADIRNDCAHANRKEPDKREVERLIKQAEKLVIK